MKNLIAIFLLLLLILLAACVGNSKEATNYHILSPTPFNTEQPDVQIMTIDEKSKSTPASPTVTYQGTIEGVLKPTPEPTRSTGILVISSRPTGAEVRIVKAGLKGNTPYSTILATGSYTVSLSLDGYQTWEETVAIFEGESSEIQRNLVPVPMGIGQYTTLAELGGVGAVADLPFLANVIWEPDEQSFVYAIGKGANLGEAKDLYWWQYDLFSKESMAIDPPQTLVNAETREKLDLCPLDDQGWDGPAKCEYLTTLFESEEHRLIAYSPLLLENPYSEGELWIAQSDGSKAQKLADFAPAYAHWSSDGQWLATGRAFAGLPGQAIHYLAMTDGSFFESLQDITGVDNFYLNGLFPEFSPNGQELLYAGSEIVESREASDYKLYSLNMDNFESRLVTDKFGLFQWAENGKGIYVLDGAFFPLESSDLGHMRETNLYYVDISQNPPQEYLIASNIPYYPFSDKGTWNWAYSPIHQSIAYVGFQGNKEFGILKLDPSTEKSE